MWTRGILASEYGVDLDAVTWVLSGDEHVAEFVAPSNVVSSPNNDLVEMLKSGEIDAAIGVRPGAAPEIKALFPEPDTDDENWHRKTGVYPISHMVVVKNARLDDNPDLAAELFRAFKTAKASGAMDAELLEMSKIVQGDPIPYGLQSSLQTLNAFIDFNVSQGVIPKRVEPEDLFPATTQTLD